MPIPSNNPTTQKKKGTLKIHFCFPLNTPGMPAHYHETRVSRFFNHFSEWHEELAKLAARDMNSINPFGAHTLAAGVCANVKMVSFYSLKYVAMISG
jgi:hypothetical protein